MIVFHPAGELHAQQFDKTTVQLFRVEVNSARLQTPGGKDLPLECLDLHKGSAIGLTRKLYQEFRHPDVVSPLAIEGLGLELIAAVARENSYRRLSLQPPQWLSHAYHLIKTRFLEPIVLGDIAGEVGVHPVTLAREFRRYYDCTAGDLVRRERIEFACHQLLESKRPLAAIASLAGFYDQSHFSRTFKRIIGTTPLQYRTTFARTKAVH